jgi:hypothetical protein
MARRLAKTVARGYGAAHRRERARWARVVASGAASCVRCGGELVPGAPWDLDHDESRQTYLGPAHVRCNRSAGARKGNRARRRRVVLAQRDDDPLAAYRGFRGPLSS